MNQKGKANIFLTSVIFIGLLASVYLVVKPVLYNSQASAPKITPTATTSPTPTITSSPRYN